MEELRTYGGAPFDVAVLHGGPGAPGEMAPVARELGASLGVVEPLLEAVTLEGQVSELTRILERRADPPVRLVGWSWGAWLALILAERHPNLVSKLVLIGSPPFTDAEAAGILATRLERLDEDSVAEVLGLMRVLEGDDLSGKQSAFERLGELFMKTDIVDPVTQDPELLRARFDVYAGVWPEAAKLRSSGELLETAGRVSCPVVAIHGDSDPHPPVGVRAPLSRVVREFHFILLDRCGHYPWLERAVRGRFFDVLREELL